MKNNGPAKIFTSQSLNPVNLQPYTQRHLAYVSNLRNLEMSCYPGLSGELSVIRVLIREKAGRPESQSQRRVWRCFTIGFENGGRGHESRNASGLSVAAWGKETDSEFPRASRRNSDLLTPISGLLTSEQ